MDLYFIAIMPYPELRKEIMRIKERIRDEYGARHALKSPAHITLQMPFKRSAVYEPEMLHALQNFASGEKSFNVDLDGFGAFVPRVIYLKITEPKPVIEMHSRLKGTLLAELLFSPEEIMREVQPHITVATRDLTWEVFSNAWTEVKDEEFKASFEVHSIFLLKHNGRHWDILEEFIFGLNLF
jgi:2'-5' RNA ligase